MERFLNLFSLLMDACISMIYSFFLSVAILVVIMKGAFDMCLSFIVINYGETNVKRYTK